MAQSIAVDSVSLTIITEAQNLSKAGLGPHWALLRDAKGSNPDM